MPVKLTAPQAASLLPVKGVQLGFAEAYVKKPNRKDVLVIKLAEGSHVAGVFTKNRFCAAPVVLCKQFLAVNNGIRALLVNTGNANAGTGEDGLKRAQQSCEALAGLLNIQPNQVLPFSTGVILEPLPVDKVIAGLPAAIDNLKEDNWLNAAEAIMTTDIVAKGTSRQLQLGGKAVTVTGISKGSGMIHPNMATMLGYIATDAAVSQTALEKIIHYAVNKSFNCITVDSDTSTSDTVLAFATGSAGNTIINCEGCEGADAFAAALTDVCRQLAHLVVKDGEGAQKFIAVSVTGAVSDASARKVGLAIANSPLVKTAIAGQDANWGRVVMAVGKAGEPADRGLGEGRATVWTCDLTHGYISINADYRS